MKQKDKRQENQEKTAASDKSLRFELSWKPEQMENLSICTPDPSFKCQENIDHFKNCVYKLQVMG